MRHSFITVASDRDRPLPLSLRFFFEGLEQLPAERELGNNFTKLFLLSSSTAEFGLRATLVNQ